MASIGRRALQDAITLLNTGDWAEAERQYRKALDFVEGNAIAAHEQQAQTKQTNPVLTILHRLFRTISISSLTTAYTRRMPISRC